MRKPVTILNDLLTTCDVNAVESVIKEYEKKGYESTPVGDFFVLIKGKNKIQRIIIKVTSKDFASCMNAPVDPEPQDTPVTPSNTSKINSSVAPVQSQASTIKIESVADIANLNREVNLFVDKATILRLYDFLLSQKPNEAKCFCEGYARTNNVSIRVDFETKQDYTNVDALFIHVSNIFGEYDFCWTETRTLARAITVQLKKPVEYYLGWLKSKKQTKAPFYDRAYIMRTAWEYKRKNPDKDFGLCLQMAWREYKSAVTEDSNQIEQLTLDEYLENGVLPIICYNGNYITLSALRDKWLAHGQTYPCKELLKKIGFKWDGNNWYLKRGNLNNARDTELYNEEFVPYYL